jgi:putative restriction endonuclease
MGSFRRGKWRVVPLRNAAAHWLLPPRLDSPRGRPDGRLHNASGAIFLARKCLDTLTALLQGCYRARQVYDCETGTGRELWNEVEQRLRFPPAAQLAEKIATTAAIESHCFGKPQILLPRLGQGSFRVVVTDAYERRCAFTGERTLPVLDAVHIKPYSVHHRHEVSNGMLMRSDLHRLFDEGYITIVPVDRRIQVSSRIREEFENGKEYYKLHGKPVRDPSQAIYRPKAENLEYHAYSVFR